MTIVEAGITGIISGLLVLIGFYIVLRMGYIETILMNSMENLLEEVTNDEKMQKSLYTVGALVGNGAKAGFGLQKRGGKMSMTDLVIQAVAGKFLGNQQQGTENVKSNESSLGME